jgi:hypothetical protein
MPTINEGPSSSPWYESGTSQSSGDAHHPNWSSANSISPFTPDAQSKVTQRAFTPSTSQLPFLSLLYLREDFLRPTVECEESGLQGGVDETMDSTSSAQVREWVVDVARPARGHTDERGRSIHVTHLMGRQTMLDEISLHPSLNLRNHFANMPLSSSIRTNNYSGYIQDLQVNNLSVPIWAMMTVNTRPDPGSIQDPFHDILQETGAMLANGMSIGQVIEVHPNIAALWDEDEFNRSGPLSKWAVGMVHSAKLKGEPSAFSSNYRG